MADSGLRIRPFFPATGHFYIFLIILPKIGQILPKFFRKISILRRFFILLKEWKDLHGRSFTNYLMPPDSEGSIEIKFWV